MLYGDGKITLSSQMNTEYLFYNGVFFPIERFFVRAHNRSFRYGDGFFESLRLIRGQLPFYEQHYRRIEKSLQLLQLPANDFIQHSALRRYCIQLAEKNNIENGRFRIHFFREGEGLYEPTTEQQTAVLIESRPIEDDEFVLNKRGLVLDIYTQYPKPQHPIFSIKSNNALPYILAALYKQQQQLDDCLLINAQGNIVEALYSNIFWVSDNTLYTPPLSEGGVEGVMRGILLQLAKIHHFPSQEKILPPDLLQYADECFLCNAVQGIRWVQVYQKKVFGNKVSRLLTELLNLQTKRLISIYQELL
ncbi:MAG: aminotransferase class IV [Sphingobacteriales bacterium]|nr:aminotransferase class IV [Sphingobacteriales bacterium]